MYQNYYFILSSVIGVITIIFNSCTAGIGNSVIVESTEKNFNDLKKFTLLIIWIAGFCSCCFLCLYQPFMKIWVGEKLMLGFTAVICFCVYYFVYEINQLLNTYKDAAGIWHEDRFRPLVTAGTNLIMNLIMVQFWGIYGVLLSTVLSTVFVGMPWLLHNLFTVLFKKEQLSEYLKILFRYIIVVAFALIISYLICQLFDINLWATLIVRIIICCIIPNIIFYFSFRRFREFRQCLKLIDNMTKGKLQLEKRLC